MQVPCQGDYIIYSPSGDPYFQDADRALCGYEDNFGNELNVIIHLMNICIDARFKVYSQAFSKFNKCGKLFHTYIKFLVFNQRLKFGFLIGMEEWKAIRLVIKLQFIFIHHTTHKEEVSPALHKLYRMSIQDVIVVLKAR